MSAIQNFAFDEQLVRVVDRDGQPWFAGKDICTALGIKDHNQALETLDDDERGTCTVPTPRGEQSMIVVSEPGVYRLVFRSRKPEAERFKRWLAHEVLPAIRRTGSYGQQQPVPPAADSAAMNERRMALDAVREARMLYGPERARALWESLPALPQIPPAPPAQRSREAEECLEHILAFPVKDKGQLRHLLSDAQFGFPLAVSALKELGVRVVDDQAEGEGVVVASAERATVRLFRGTPWTRGRHTAFLRALPGALPYKAMKFADNYTAMGTFLPLALVAGD